MRKDIILHISEINISLNSGVGRVEYYWKKAFEKAGFDFIHIGPMEVGKLKHKALFPYEAYKYYKNLKIVPRAIIVHEPASRYFVQNGIPCFIESHGVERRGWEMQLNDEEIQDKNNKLSLRTRLLFPLWRLNGCDIGLKKGNKLLLINSEDKEYVIDKYNRIEEDILIFKNGVNIYSLPNHKANNLPYTVLFNGSWVARKGIHTLVNAVNILYQQGIELNYILIGTGVDGDTVLSDWPEHLRSYVRVIPNFPPEDEIQFLSNSSLFVLPSYFEGQPLSLLQAMGAGKCCITSNCCGQKDIIENGKTGFLFEKGDSQELAELISMCNNNRALADEIGINAKEYVGKLSWENVSEKIVDYIVRNSTVEV